MKITKLLIITVLTFGSIFSVVAQSTTSPYSKFGYGFLNDNASSAQRAMGGVGYAMNSGRQINIMNPASYAAIDSLTFLFDMGLNYNTVWSSENGVKAKEYSGGIDYITLQFPITKYMGASIGMVPFSSVGYSFGDEIVHGSNSREGNGGINQLYAGLGANVYKNLYLGANISYLFGTIINDAYAFTDNGSTSLFERVMQIRDWKVQFGAQYTIDFSRKNRGTIGIIYSPGKSLLGKTWGTYYDIDSDEKDSKVVGETSLKNNYSLPDTWGVGLNYEWNKSLMAEVDLTYQPWEDAKSAPIVNENTGEVVFDNTKFDNRWKIATGVQYTPKARGNYLQRITYRIGGFYNHDYVLVNGNNLCDYGLTAGFGLPAPKSKTVINLGFEWRRREASPNTLIKEDYFNITLGINFNEMWFWRNKIR